MAAKLCLGVFLMLALGCGSAGAGSGATVTPHDSESHEQRRCDADHAGDTFVREDQDCVCRLVSRCSGVDMGDEINSAPLPHAWRCDYHEGVIRPDGCPGRIPQEGTPCDGARYCSYGSCCMETVACEDGAWRSTGPAQCPP